MRLPGPDDFALPIVGEASYQETLRRLARGRRVAYFDAHLVLEDNNPYDDQAVRVDINGKTVGYLSRAHARQYRQRLAEAGLSGEQVCRCKVVGGDSDRIGVWLDLPVEVGRLG